MKCEEQPLLSPCHIAAVASVLLFGPFSVTAGADESNELRRRFLEEAPAKWAEYASFSERLCGTIMILKKTDGALNFNRRYECKQNSVCRLVMFQSLVAKDPGGELFASNSKYSFTLNRKAQDSPWILAGLRMSTDGIEPRVEIETRDNLKVLRSLVQLHARDLSELLKEPTFKVEHAQKVQREGESLVQIEFSNAHPVPKNAKDFFPVQGGKLILDPDRSWCLRACSVDCKNPNFVSRLTIETTLRADTYQYPVPETVVESYALRFEPEGGMTVSFSKQFDLRDPGELPDEKEFTLSALGLPEPVGISWEAPTRWYLWVALAGVLLVVAGMCFRRLRTRLR